MVRKRCPHQKMTFKQKCTYIFEGFVTMEAVHLLAKPFKRGLNNLSKRLKKASNKKEKNSLKKQLQLGTHSKKNKQRP